MNKEEKIQYLEKIWNQIFEIGIDLVNFKQLEGLVLVDGINNHFYKMDDCLLSARVHIVEIQRKL